MRLLYRLRNTFNLGLREPAWRNKEKRQECEHHLRAARNCPPEFELLLKKIIFKSSSLNRARDSALRAISLSSRGSFSFFYPILLSKVTIRAGDLINFDRSLERNPGFGAMVKSIKIAERAFMTREEGVELHKQLAQMSSLSTSASAEVQDRIHDGAFRVVGSIYSKLVRLQALDVDHSWAMPLINGKVSTLPLFNHLKRLFIPRWSNYGIGVNNIVWFLVFIPTISEASFNFVIFTADYSYLLEHEAALSGISNVKTLALQFEYAIKTSDSRTWWDDIPPEDGQRWTYSNKKTQTISLLLSITKNLTCLELFHRQDFEERERGNLSKVSTNCIGSLHRSVTSLQHFRLFLGGIDPSSPVETIRNPFKRFKSLRVLTLDAMLLLALNLALNQSPQVDLPLSIEVLKVPFQAFSDQHPLKDQVDDLLEVLKLIESRKFPNLKRVVVPDQPVRAIGLPIEMEEYFQRWDKRTETEEYIQRWDKSCKALEKKVKVIRTKPGELGESRLKELVPHLSIDVGVHRLLANAETSASSTSFSTLSWGTGRELSLFSRLAIWHSSLRSRMKNHAAG